MLHVMVGTDGSEAAGRAVKFAADLTQQTSGRLTVAHVLPPLNLPPEAAALPDYLQYVEDARRKAGEQLLQEQKEVCTRQRAIPVETVLLNGPVAHELEEAAVKQQADLLVVGTRGFGAVKRALLGSVSARLAHGCNRPVTIVP